LGATLGVRRKKGRTVKGLGGGGRQVIAKKQEGIQETVMNCKHSRLGNSTNNQGEKGFEREWSSRNGEWLEIEGHYAGI